VEKELAYRDEAAAGYDRAFAHVSSRFVPPLLRAAHLAPGMRVLDVAAGTGLVAEAALAVVGPTGHVTATDISPAMLARARERLGGAPNTTVAVEDGQALPFPDGSFDAVVCGLGLMFFPDPARGLSGFRRVLRHGGHAAASVTASVEGAYNGLISLAIARRAPSLMDEAAVRRFDFGADAVCVAPSATRAGRSRWRSRSGSSAGAGRARAPERAAAGRVQTSRGRRRMAEGLTYGGAAAAGYDQRAEDRPLTWRQRSG